MSFISQLFKTEPSGYCFGLSLEKVMGSQGEKGLPKLVSFALKSIRDTGLTCEGLFRVAPAQSSIQKARLAFDESDNPQYSFSEPGGVNIACSLLKAYVRELPQPLIKDSLFPLLEELKAASDRINFIKSKILIKLHKPQLILLREITRLLSEVHQNSTVTKMDSNNLTIIWIPNFIAEKDLLDQKISGSSSGLYLFIKLCIEEHEKIF